jgi:nucleoside-diphosphate-sugar epimerase
LSTDEYGLSKARQENILFSSKLSNWSIIRPYITFGIDRLQLGVFEKEEWLYRGLNGRSIVFSKDINYRMTTLTYSEDVAKGILSIIGQNDALGEVFQITSPKSLRWSNVLNNYLNVIKEYHLECPRVIMVDLKTFIKAFPGRYQIIYDRLYDRVFDCKKINRFIDTKEFKEPMELLNICMKSFVKKLNFNKISGRREALKDRLTREKTPLQNFSSFKNKLAYIIYSYVFR